MKIERIAAHATIGIEELFQSFSKSLAQKSNFEQCYASGYPNLYEIFESAAKLFSQ